MRDRGSGEGAQTQVAPRHSAPPPGREGESGARGGSRRVRGKLRKGSLGVGMGSARTKKGDSVSPPVPHLKFYWTWLPSLLHDFRLRVFSIPRSTAPRDRQRNLPMAGRKASTLCSPATLSQCAPVSPESRLPCRAPPSGNTGTNPICRHVECGTVINIFFSGTFSHLF